LRPNVLMEVRGIGQTARLSSRSLGDFTKRGGWIWTTRLHLVRQARRCEGGFLVGRTSWIYAGCAVTHKRPTGYEPEFCGASDAGHEEHKRLGSTTSPPTGNSHNLTSRGSLGPQTYRTEIGVLSANHGRPPTIVQGRPYCIQLVKTPTFIPAQPLARRDAPSPSIVVASHQASIYKSTEGKVPIRSQLIEASGSSEA